MTEETATGQPTLMIEPAPMARPYAASWVDYLGDLVHRLPGPWFVYYLGACLLLFLTANAIKWFDGSQVMWAIEPLWAIRNGSSIYFLGLMVYLTGAARRAWASFAPALAASPGESAQLYYRLTHLPAWPTLLAGGIGLAVAACSILFESPPDDWSTSQLALAFDAFDYALTASVFATMLYYTIHQITTVRLIHTVA
ncbi:MAG: hypothetical protein KJ734_00935, partial [Chloroflexi bacterium]|nr:hypothetical protein [Chloroflexota bacterium]